MTKECEFYEGRSQCFQIAPGNHKTISFTLRKACVCASDRILFRGRVIDNCSGKAIKSVRINIKYVTFQQSEYTDENGCFNFNLPCYIDIVSIYFCKRGFINRYINMYRFKQNSDNCFRLYEMD